MENIKEDLLNVLITTLYIVALFTWISIFLSLAGCKGVDYNQRYFYELTEGRSHYALACFDCDGAYSQFIELDENGVPITGDTLTVWTQHFSKEMGHLDSNALFADMIVSCYPNHVSNGLRSRHIFPSHDDLLRVDWAPGPFVIVTEVDSTSQPVEFPDFYKDNNPSQ